MVIGNAIKHIVVYLGVCCRSHRGICITNAYSAGTVVEDVVMNQIITGICSCNSQTQGISLKSIVPGYNSITSFNVNGCTHIRTIDKCTMLDNSRCIVG